MNTIPIPPCLEGTSTAEFLKSLPAERFVPRVAKPLRNMTFDEAVLLFSFHFKREPDPADFSFLVGEYSCEMTDGIDLLFIDHDPTYDEPILVTETRDIDEDDTAEDLALKQSSISDKDLEYLLNMVETIGCIRPTTGTESH